MKILSKNADIEWLSGLLIRFMKDYLRYFITTLLFSICTVSILEAQTVLERISITERADGRGVVIRNHLSMIPDSFRVIQPAENLIQFVIYSERLESENFVKAELTDDIEQIEYHAGPVFFAYEITLSEGIFYLGNAYMDVNQSDVLLALERIEESDLSGVIEPGLELFLEEGITDEEIPITDSERRSPDIEDSDKMDMSSINVRFGIKGGWTSANIYGVGYGRNPRSGVTTAATAVINFPAYLPYDLSLGLETGVYFTQKGFTDITSTKFSGIEVEFDYIEIPILVKLKYRDQNRFSPHLIVGPYLGFLANAENVRENSERSDLDEFTSVVDFGGVAGVGVDFRINDIVLDLQIRQSLGFNTLFNEVSYNDNEKLRQLSLVFGLRF